jgi:signal transduction histidine kinase
MAVSYLTIAQCMAAAAFLAMAFVHLLVWFRVRSEINHLLFAVTLSAAAASALAEANMYQSRSIGAMAVALRWYVTTSGLWAISTVTFIAFYTRVSRVGRGFAAAIAAILSLAILLNLFAPASFLYTELTGLRQLTLPWGEQFWLATGRDNPLRLVTELALVSILVVVADGCGRYWRRGEPARAVLFGTAVLGFMVCFGGHAFLVDTGRLNSPYLSTFGFLALVGFMSFELAGDVLKKVQLSSELVQKEDELLAAVEDERTRIAGDLHDSVTQTLFSTAAIADALPAVWDRHPREARQGLDDLKSLTKGALAEMRTLLLELRPAALLEKTFGELLQQLARAATGRTRMSADVQIIGDTRLTDDLQVALYRVAQETLNNVVKHARASDIEIRFACDEHTVKLTIRDNGRGFELEESIPAGMGLQIMRERVKAVGGSLQIESTPQAGTTIGVIFHRRNSGSRTDGR